MGSPIGHGARVTKPSSSNPNRTAHGVPQAAIFLVWFPQVLRKTLMSLMVPSQDHNAIRPAPNNRMQQLSWLHKTI